MSIEERKKLIEAAFGDKKADLVLKNGRIINVFTNELERADVAIVGEYIAGVGSYEGEQEIDLNGSVICPGLIDGHIHLESSMLSPDEFARSVVPHGTTAVITDPHEIANVAGTAGIDYMLQATEGLPLDVFFMLPSCVPATSMDESGAVLDAEQLRKYYSNPRVLGLAELMNAFGTVRRDEGIMDKLDSAAEFGKIVDGHAPGLTGNELNAYVAAGVKSDHECSTSAEGIEKIKRGQWVMIREGTAAKNLSALLPLFGKKYYSRCMLVTDDKHPGDLIEFGHIDYIIREAARRGENPIYAVKMASFNAAQYFGLKEMGAIAPGYKANILILDELETFRVNTVYKNGRIVAQNGKLCVPAVRQRVNEAVLAQVKHSFHMDELEPEDLKIRETGRFKRVIGLTRGELLTKELIVPNTAVGAGARGEGEAAGDGATGDSYKVTDSEGIEYTTSGTAEGVELDRDIVKLAVIERHKNTGHIGLGFVYGYGLKCGAVASSIAHDSHNLIVIGTNDEDICLAANTVLRNQGGLAAVRNGEVLGELALPIGGLMCEEAAEKVESELNKLKAYTREMGVSLKIDPFMTLSFISLPVIPSLRLTTKGLVNVETYEYVPVLFG